MPTKIRTFEGVRIEIDTRTAFNEVLARLRHLTGKASIPAVLELAQSAGTPEAYDREVNARFVGESGFMFFAEIDHGAWISVYGIERRTIRWVLGNPLYAITMLRHDLDAGLFVPVELLLTEAEDKQGARLIYVRPSSLIAIGDDGDLRTAAEALDAKLAALVARVTAE